MREIWKEISRETELRERERERERQREITFSPGLRAEPIWRGKER